MESTVLQHHQLVTFLAVAHILLIFPLFHSTCQQFNICGYLEYILGNYCNQMSNILSFIPDADRSKFS